MTEEFSYPEMPIIPMEHDKYIPEEFSAVGKRGIRRRDGYEKASGKGIYAGDVKLPGMLYAKILTSPYAHAAIKSMDVSKAEALHGVRYILRYDDPDMYTESNSWGVNWPVPDIAYFEGQPVGAIVCADTEDICDEALKLIDIEWEERDFVLDWEKAAEAGAPLAKPEINPDDNIITPRSPYTTEQGDVEAGFAEADGTIEFHGIRQEHTWAGVESHNVTARWDGDYLEIWVKYQRPYHIKATAAAKWFKIPVSRIKLHMPYSGGMFGGWSWVTLNMIYHYAPCLLAQRTGKPVKFIYNSHFCGCSLDLISANFKVGYKNDGTITAVEMANKFGPDAKWNGALHILENTKIPNVYCDQISAHVNRGPAVSMRCEQLPHTMCLNLIFGHVADALNMDPTEVALKNDGCEGKGMDYLSEFKLEHGFPDIDSLKECLNAGKAAIDWDNKWHLPGTKQLSNGKMHGIAMGWTHEWDSARGAGSAGILIERDGSVNILSSRLDVGLNAESTYCDIAADTIGVLPEVVHIRIMEDPGFFLMSPDGSCNLCTNGYVIRKAAKRAKARLLRMATATGEYSGVSSFFPDKTPEELDVKNGDIFEVAAPENKLTVAEVVGSYWGNNWGMSMGHTTIDPVFAWAWHRQGSMNLEEGRHRLSRQAHFMEVEVDTDTGEVEITNVVCVNDVGKAISPEGTEAQQYGGMIMAASRGRNEEVIYDPGTGVKLNDNLADYKVATILDCGPIESILIESGLGYGPYGAEGIGENVADHPASLISLAVHNAIGKWAEEFPVTPDNVLKALGKA